MLLGRKFIRVSKEDPVLTVFHWNTLSDQLSGFFPSIDDKYLDWSNRKDKISAEILSINSDIVCLTEIDHYEDFLQPLLLNKGYNSIFKKKKSWHRDGLCIGYDMQKFRYVHHTSIQYPNSNQFALLLKLLLGTIELLVISTHLKSGSQYEDDRVDQIKYLIKRLEEYKGTSIILCGDFNCEPFSKTYNIIINQNFTSAYFNNVLKNSEPEITTYQKREQVMYKTIDYIFFKGFEVTSVLSMPTLKEIEKTGIPSEAYPSDHISLACKASFKYNCLL
jgi:mRNA deadenylase 3'-5' endonuclease subunit Ccr4